MEVQNSQNPNDDSGAKQDEDILRKGKKKFKRRSTGEIVENIHLGVNKDARLIGRNLRNPQSGAGAWGKRSFLDPLKEVK